MDERKVAELTTKAEISASDLIVIEDEDGTKTAPATGLKKFMINNLIFNTVEDLKSASLKEGETCLTLGYRSVNDGGAAAYKIEYDPAAVEDKGMVHYLHTSDTLRAKLIVEDYIVPEQFGAYGNGNNDDISAITKAIKSGFSVKFVSNHKYKISSPIELFSDTILDFNGCTLIPINCDLFSKKKISNEDPIQNVTIKNFIADMKNGFNCINIYHPVDGLSITGFKITNIKRYAVRLGSVVHGIIKNAIISGYDETNSQCGIGIINPTTSNFGDSSIYIDSVSFRNVYPAIIVNNADETDPKINHITIKNCNYTNSYHNEYSDFIQIYGKKNDIIIDNICAYLVHSGVIVKANSIDTNVSIKDIYAEDCNSLLDIINTDTIVNLYGNIRIKSYNYNGNSRTISVILPIVYRLYGTLNMNCNFDIDDQLYQFRDNASESNYSGSVQDYLDPKNYPIEIITSGTDSISISALGNSFIDIQTSSNVVSINNGIEGQRIYLISSTNKSIVPSANIILKDNVTQKLSANSGIELKRINKKWVQI